MPIALKQLTAKDHDRIQNEYAAFMVFYDSMMRFHSAAESAHIPNDWRNWSSRLRRELEEKFEALRRDHSNLCDAKIVVEGLKEREQTLMPF